MIGNLLFHFQTEESDTDLIFEDKFVEDLSNSQSKLADIKKRNVKGSIDDFVIEDQHQNAHDEHWLSRIKRNVVNFFSQEVKDDEKPLKKHNVKKVDEKTLPNLKKARKNPAKKSKVLKKNMKYSTNGYRPKRQDE